MENYTKSFTSETTFAGMDVHKKTIAFCVYSVNTGEVLDERELAHDLPKVIKHLLKIEDRHGKIHTCYEASSCGFGLQRALEAHGISCEVIAPSSIPRRSGERVKTDRRDARKLATLYAAGLLTTINIPDEEQEAIRSFLRCRSDLTDTIVRAKQWILAFLLTRGFRYPGKSHCTKMFHTWVRALPMAEMDRTTLHTYLYQLEQLKCADLRPIWPRSPTKIAMKRPSRS